MVIVVGNKADKSPRAVDKKVIQGWLQNFYHFKYVEISAATGMGV